MAVALAAVRTPSAEQAKAVVPPSRAYPGAALMSQDAPAVRFPPMVQAFVFAPESVSYTHLTLPTTPYV